MVAEFNADVADPVFTAMTRVAGYAWGLDLSGTLTGTGGVGGLVAQWRAGQAGEGASAASQLWLPCYDGNGNVTEIVAAGSANAGASWEYSAFGETVTVTGAAAAAMPFRFSTKYTDGETGLVYYGYRYYAPELGRWLGSDPLGERGGVNLFGMVGNDAVNGVDLLGMVSVPYPHDPGPISSGDNSWFPDVAQVIRQAGQNVYESLKQIGERALDSVTRSVEDQFSQFKDRAKQKVSFNFDLRSPKGNFGILEIRGGGRVRVTSNGCCVKVSGGPSLWVEARGQGLITLSGGVNVTARGTYQYCWTDGKEEWGGEWGGTGRLGLRVGLDAWVAKAYGEGGGYVSYTRSFGGAQGNWGVGIYARAVFAAGWGKWERRREYTWSWGDSNVGF
jgi:RHS repeat-associated protein